MSGHVRAREARVHPTQLFNIRPLSTTGLYFYQSPSIYFTGRSNVNYSLEQPRVAQNSTEVLTKVMFN